MTRPVNVIENDNLVDSRIFKSPLITARIALVIQLLKWACGESHKDNVDIDSVKSAIRLTEYFESCYKRIEVFMNSESLTPQKKTYLIIFLKSLPRVMLSKQVKRSVCQRDQSCIHFQSLTKLILLEKSNMENMRNCNKSPYLQIAVSAVCSF